MKFTVGVAGDLPVNVKDVKRLADLPKFTLYPVMKDLPRQDPLYKRVVASFLLCIVITACSVQYLPVFANSK